MATACFPLSWKNGAFFVLYLLTAARAVDHFSLDLNRFLGCLPRYTRRYMYIEVFADTYVFMHVNGSYVHHHIGVNSIYILDICLVYRDAVLRRVCRGVSKERGLGIESPCIDATGKLEITRDRIVSRSWMCSENSLFQVAFCTVAFSINDVNFIRVMKSCRFFTTRAS